jgi:nifR3 family TIM-barrel protein
VAFQIGKLDIKSDLVLAPMSGVTNSAFRRLIKELNPNCVGLTVSEFISIEGLTRGSLKSSAMMRFAEIERPFGVQIFGFDVERMCEAARMVQDVGADLVDINCGCPAPKVVKRGGGCELMRQPEHLKELVRRVRCAVSIPLTVKFRSGWCENSINAIQIGKMLEDEGVDAIAIHGRTRAQMYRGMADWEIVRELVESVGIPVGGSGDVVSYQSALQRKQSGVASLFIGRAALANPYVFSEIKGINCYNNTDSLDERSCRVERVLSRYAELLRETFEPRGCVGPLKQLASQMGKGIEWVKNFCRCTTLDEQLTLLSRVRNGDVVSFSH